MFRFFLIIYFSFCCLSPALASDAQDVDNIVQSFKTSMGNKDAQSISSLLDNSVELTYSNLHSTYSVSYTHLDVYKRQDMYDTRCATGYTDAVGKFFPNSPLAADTVNTQNIMDYSYCEKMFTIGQANRMRAALTSSIAGRNNLYSPTNLAATGALQPRPDLKPTPDFSIEKGVFVWGGPTAERTVFLCQNSSTQFQFRNKSWNDRITNVNWSFSNNASTATSTEMASPVYNSFSDAGWATITLEAIGNNSGCLLYTSRCV